jgi:hypothetical protein
LTWGVAAKIARGELGTIGIITSFRSEKAWAIPTT